MSDKFDAIIPKITPLIRLLSSPTEQEAVAALRMLLRLLSKNDLDIHALADRVEHGGGETLSAGEMQAIYDAAYQKGHADGADQGRRSAVLATARPWQLRAAGVSVDDGVNGYSWQQMVQHCLATKHLFRDRDLDFIESVSEQLEYKHISPPQAKWLRDLFMRKFRGKIE
jgi:hypothetical protein